MMTVTLFFDTLYIKILKLHWKFQFAYLPVKILSKNKHFKECFNIYISKTRTRITDRNFHEMTQGTCSKSLSVYFWDTLVLLSKVLTVSQLHYSSIFNKTIIEMMSYQIISKHKKYKIFPRDFMTSNILNDTFYYICKLLNSFSYTVRRRQTIFTHFQETICFAAI